MTTNNGRTASNGRTAMLIGLIAIAATVAVVLFGNIKAGFKFAEPIWGPATAVVTALLITTLFVERSMAVINALLFGDRQREAELQLLGIAPVADTETAARTVAAVFSSKERVRLLLSFVAGLFVAAAGVRVLQGLLAAPPDANTHPWFFPADVILTAGLIAGGSNGLAFLLQLLKDRFTPGEGNGTGAAPGTTNTTESPARALKASAPAGRRRAAPVNAAALRARLTTG